MALELRRQEVSGAGGLYFAEPPASPPDHGIAPLSAEGSQAALTGLRRAWIGPKRRNGTGAAAVRAVTNSVMGRSTTMARLSPLPVKRRKGGQVNAWRKRTLHPCRFGRPWGHGLGWLWPAPFASGEGRWDLTYEPGPMSRRKSGKVEAEFIPPRVPPTPRPNQRRDFIGGLV